MQASSSVIDITEARRRLRAVAGDGAEQGPSWKKDIRTCCAYARLVRAEHEAESARIKFDQIERGVGDSWWQGPDDLKHRVNANNTQWDIYIALLRHIAALPAATRSEAANKRNTIGKMWLAEDCADTRLLGPLRTGCLRDDHLFPPSMRLARR